MTTVVKEAAAAATTRRRWWQKTTLYQVYPRSFCDSNGDGIGDIPGIISRLDYLKDLGVETLWFSPFYASPQTDHGYDVSDYRAIAPEYGTMQDVERLIAGVHARGMRVVLDMVMNHTSVEHRWFKESRSSRSNPRRNWYIWRDGRGRRPPTNWASFVSPRAWVHDDVTGQWYLASCFPFQPDLNYDNPEVKREMFNTLRFWLDKGVDGFRLDIFHAIHKDPEFRDNPFRLKFFLSENDHDAYFQRRIRTINHPRTFELAREVRAVLDEYPGDRFAVGEVAGPPDVIKQYLGARLDGLNLIFMFDTLRFQFDAAWFRELLLRLERDFPEPYVPTWVFGNHDQPRLMKKLGNDERKARVLALLQLTARGVPVTYYGEEIGMTSAAVTLRDAQDPVARMYGWIPQAVGERTGLADVIIRDRARAPMQWDDSHNAGFSGPGAQPWLPVHPNAAAINVRAQAADPTSLLATYRRLFALRRSSAALQEGSLRVLPLSEAPAPVLAFARQLGDERLLVLINFGEALAVVPNRSGCHDVVFTTETTPPRDTGALLLPAVSGLVLRSA